MSSRFTKQLPYTDLVRNKHSGSAGGLIRIAPDLSQLTIGELDQLRAIAIMILPKAAGGDRRKQFISRGRPRVDLGSSRFPDQYRFGALQNLPTRALEK